MIALAPCPPLLADQDRPEYGGSLFFHQDTGIAGCTHCGWTGIPTIVHGFASTWCPRCQHDVDRWPPHSPHRVPRNQACPCGSGAKAKRCDCPSFTV